MLWTGRFLTIRQIPILIPIIANDTCVVMGLVGAVCGDGVVVIVVIEVINKRMGGTSPVDA